MSNSCNPMDCNTPDSSIHRSCQARILEWVAISFSRGSSWPRDWICVSCLTGEFFTADLTDQNGMTNSIWGHRPQTIESMVPNRYLCTHIQSSTLHNNQKVEAAQVAITGWMNKQNVVSTMGYYLAFRRKEILACAITWVNFDDILLVSDISQKQKDKYCMILFIWGT